MIKCIACGGHVDIPLIKGIFTRTGHSLAFTVVACSDCGLGLTIPNPNLGYEPPSSESIELRAHYQKRLDGDTWSGGIVKDLMSYYRAPRDIEPVFVDVGCNVGAALDAAKLAGYRAIGVELDIHAYELASSRHLVYHQPLEEAPIACGSVDIILMSHVLEHIPNPKSVISAACGMLKQNGVLGIRVPNYQGILPKLMKDNWMGWYADQHYWHFTAKSLLKLIAKSEGLEAVHVSCRGSAEPRSCGLKGVAKQLIARACAVCGYGDELYVVCRRTREDKLLVDYGGKSRQ